MSSSDSYFASDSEIHLEGSGGRRRRRRQRRKLKKGILGEANTSTRTSRDGESKTTRKEKEEEKTETIRSNKDEQEKVRNQNQIEKMVLKPRSTVYGDDTDSSPLITINKKGASNGRKKSHSNPKEDNSIEAIDDTPRPTSSTKESINSSEFKRSRSHDRSSENRNQTYHRITKEVIDDRPRHTSLPQEFINSTDFKRNKLSDQNSKSRSQSNRTSTSDKTSMATTGGKRTSEGLKDSYTDTKDSNNRSQSTRHRSVEETFNMNPTNSKDNLTIERESYHSSEPKEGNSDKKSQDRESKIKTHDQANDYRVKEISSFSKKQHRQDKEYELTVVTGKMKAAGTCANVFVTIHGREGDSPKLTLQESTNADAENLFQRGSTNTFHLTFKDIGEIQSLRIEIRGKGIGTGWYLDHLLLESVDNSGVALYFPFNDWLAGGEGMEPYRDIFAHKTEKPNNNIDVSTKSKIPSKEASPTKLGPESNSKNMCGICGKPQNSAIECVLPILKDWQAVKQMCAAGLTDPGKISTTSE